MPPQQTSIPRTGGVKSGGRNKDWQKGETVIATVKRAQETMSQILFNAHEQWWERLPLPNFRNHMVTHNLNELSTAGVTWQLGLYGPKAKPVRAINCADPSLRRIVYGSIVPKLMARLAEGSLFRRAFDQQEATIDLDKPEISRFLW